MTNESLVMTIAVYISFVLLTLGMIFTFLRLVKGPSLPDRVLSIDLFTMFIMGAIVIYSFFKGLDVYLNAVLILAFIAFIGTVSFARYLEKGVSNE